MDILDYPIKLRLRFIQAHSLFGVINRIYSVLNIQPHMMGDKVEIPGLLEISIGIEEGEDFSSTPHAEMVKLHELESLKLDAALLKLYADSVFEAARGIGAGFNIFTRIGAPGFSEGSKTVQIMNIGFTENINKEKSQEQINDLVQQTEEKVKAAENESGR